MASASRQFYLFISRTAACSPAKRQCRTFLRGSKQISPIRTITTAAPRWAERKQPPASKVEDQPEEKPEDFDMSELQTPAQPLKPSDLEAEQRALFDKMSKDEQIHHMAIQNHLKAVLESEEQLPDDFEAEMNDVVKGMERQLPELNFRERRDLYGIQAGFWADDEADDEFTQLPDDDDSSDESHFSSIAESELELHRELRDYHRIAAWDLPLLSKFAKPFEPPTHATPLRFRYTTYMGESHPASRKVVCEFTSRDIAQSASLTEPQRIKLLKLVGVRYNPNTDTIKMSSEKFDNAAQNKRYLGDLVGKLLKEAKDATDMFEDVPLDFRHVKTKKTYEFPEEWKIKPDTVQKLLEKRAGLKMLPEADGTGDKVVPVDGEKLVEEYVVANTVVPTMRR